MRVVSAVHLRHRAPFSTVRREIMGTQIAGTNSREGICLSGPRKPMRSGLLADRPEGRCPFLPVAIAGKQGDAPHSLRVHSPWPGQSFLKASLTCSPACFRSHLAWLASNRTRCLPKLRT